MQFDCADGRADELAMARIDRLQPLIQRIEGLADLAPLYSSSSPIQSLAGIAKAFDSFGPSYRGEKSAAALLPVPKLEP